MAKLNVTKRGSKWQYSFEAAKVDGKRKRISKCGFSTKKEAMKAGTEALAQYNSSGLAFEPSNLSYSDYLDYWIKNYGEINVKPGTLEGYEQIIRNHIKPNLGFYKLSALNPATLQEFINERYLNGYSKNYLSSFIGVLSGSLKYAVYPCAFIKENPMNYVSMPKFYDEDEDENDGKKTITIEQFNKIIERFPLGSSFYIQLMIGFHTGFRIGEVCALTWQDIDFENKTIQVNKGIRKINKKWFFTTPKTKSSNRTIKIGDTLISALKKHKNMQSKNKLKYGEYYTKQYKDKDGALYSFPCNSSITIPFDEIDLVCTKENGEMSTPESFKYASRVINYKLNIPFSFHYLRHTHATILIENGANMKYVQKRLGHAKLSTTMDTYSHVTPKMENNTVDIFEKSIKEL